MYEYEQLRPLLVERCWQLFKKYPGSKIVLRDAALSTLDVRFGLDFHGRRRGHANRQSGLSSDPRHLNRNDAVQSSLSTLQHLDSKLLVSLPGVPKVQRGRF